MDIHIHRHIHMNIYTYICIISIHEVIEGNNWCANISNPSIHPHCTTNSTYRTQYTRYLQYLQYVRYLQKSTYGTHSTYSTYLRWLPDARTFSVAMNTHTDNLTTVHLTRKTDISVRCHLRHGNSVRDRQMNWCQFILSSRMSVAISVEYRLQGLPRILSCIHS